MTNATFDLLFDYTFRCRLPFFTLMALSAIFFLLFLLEESIKSFDPDAIRYYTKIVNKPTSVAFVDSEKKLH